MERSKSTNDLSQFLPQTLTLLTERNRIEQINNEEIREIHRSKSYEDVTKNNDK